MKRKDVLTNPAVVAAIENLQRAAMAVNGDEKVENTMIVLDLRTGVEGHMLVYSNICPCNGCTRRIGRAVVNTLAEAIKSREPESPGVLQ